jgi:acetyl esterase/lipase
MRNAFLIVVSCLVATAASGQEFWSHRVMVRNDVAYGDDPAQVMDIYTQGGRRGPDAPIFAASDADRPILIWIHGGAWLAGDKATAFPDAIHYMERGWDVVNVNYRLGPDTAPAAVDDAMCAYKWVVDQALSSGRENFVVSGASAGGHLALVVGLMNAGGNHPCRASVTPRAVVNWFGITDIADLHSYFAANNPQGDYALTWIGDVSEIDDVSRQYSPMELLSDRAPPIITIHGTADTVVPYSQAEALHNALKTRNQLVTMEAGGHGRFTDPQWQDARSTIFEFLASVK